MEIEVVDLPPQRLAATRHVGPFERIGEAFERLGRWVEGNPGAAVGPPLAIYLDDPNSTPIEQLRSDAAVPITAGAPMMGVPGSGVPGVGEAQLPGGRYAIATHRGPYSGLGPAWGAFLGSLAAHGLTLDASRPCFEVYRTGPDEVDEADLVTVLHQPVG